MRTKEIWKPPDASCFKINFDGAIFRNENRSCTGVVIQDHAGSIIASLAQLISLAYQPTEIEAIATAQALEFGQEIDFTSHARGLTNCSVIEDYYSTNEEDMITDEAVQKLLLKLALVFKGWYSVLFMHKCCW
nr:hypothetical protein CFP56_66419 [Quercus suber]